MFEISEMLILIVNNPIIINLAKRVPESTIYSKNQDSFFPRSEAGSHTSKILEGILNFDK